MASHYKEVLNIFADLQRLPPGTEIIIYEGKKLKGSLIM